MYLRFVLSARDLTTGARQGLVTAAYDLMRSDSLAEYEEAELRSAVKELERTLPVPTNFSRKKNDSHKNHRGLSWIKPEATSTISCLRKIQAVLENHDVSVEVLSAEKPGRIVYEDEYQIVAELRSGAGD